MSIPIFGVNIPVPQIKIPNELLEKYADLYKGIRDRKDTVTWRTLIINIRILLGQDEPDFNKIQKKYKVKAKKLVKQLVAKTFLDKLIPEIEYAVGVIDAPNKNVSKDLDFLLLNAKHTCDPMVWNLADYIKGRGKTVAVVNPVGHYNDGQTRIIGPIKFFRNIKKVIIISSTQTELGGSVSVLSNVIRLIRNPEFAKKIKEVDIIIPMFGGSRGHRLGQGPEVGFEIMEAGFNARLLAISTKDILNKLNETHIKLPSIKFFSVDIHNLEEPDKTFTEEGFEFKSIDSANGLSVGIFNILRQKKLLKIPIKLIACDKGAVPRTEKLAENILMIDGVINLQIVYMEKKRATAGVIKHTEIVRVEEWKLNGKDILKRQLSLPKKPNFKHVVLVYSDDMIDTGGTAEKDLNFISNFYPNTTLKIFAATHPVFSKGFAALKRIGADYYCLGNTLYWEGLEDMSNVEIIDMAPSIYKSI